MSVAATVATGTRTATMLLAIVVVGFVAVDRSRSGSATEPRRLRTAATVVAIGLGPAAVLFGWFYVRMQLLYGDVGASAFLLRHFERERRGSIPDMLTQGRLWVHLFQRLASTAPLSWARPRFVNLVGLVAVAGLIVALARPRSARAGGRSPSASSPLAVVTMTVAQHLAGGGSPYPRYFFPMLGVLAALAGRSPTTVSLPRLLPAVVVAAMAWWAIRQMPIGVDPATTRRPRDNGAVPPPALRVLPVGDVWRMVAAGTIAAGGRFVVLVAAEPMAGTMLRFACCGGGERPTWLP